MHHRWSQKKTRSNTRLCLYHVEILQIVRVLYWLCSLYKHFLFSPYQIRVNKHRWCCCWWCHGEMLATRTVSFGTKPSSSVDTRILWNPNRKTQTHIKGGTHLVSLHIPSGGALRVAVGPCGLSVTGLCRRPLSGTPAMPLNGQEKWTSAGRRTAVPHYRTLGLGPGSQLILGLGSSSSSATMILTCRTHCKQEQLPSPYPPRVKFGPGHTL